MTELIVTHLPMLAIGVFIVVLTCHLSYQYRKLRSEQSDALELARRLREQGLNTAANLLQDYAAGDHVGLAAGIQQMTKPSAKPVSTKASQPVRSLDAQSRKVVRALGM